MCSIFKVDKIDFFVTCYKQKSTSNANDKDEDIHHQLIKQLLILKILKNGVHPQTSYIKT